MHKQEPTWGLVMLCRNPSTAVSAFTQKVLLCGEDLLTGPWTQNCLEQVELYEDKLLGGMFSTDKFYNATSAPVHRYVFMKEKLSLRIEFKNKLLFI